MVTLANPARTLSWRVVDIIVASILAVACGLVFVFWNSVGYAWFMAMDALTPGLGGLATGIWLAGGVIGALVIRKPGAAIYVETLAATVSAVFGSQWGPETLYSGLAQGLGVEIVFAIFLYRRFSLTVAALGGIGAAIGAFVLELFTSANIAKSLEFNLIYLTCLVISGAILAGALSFFAVKALAKTGALDRFAVGREQRER
ncbi:MAG: ECF transporter S component [Corynebacterium casei]|jgi:energy-coupling factor transport system substrate-specific component|uniref:ABC-type transport system, permease component n=2 Tax=Corynebacterium casei TaxID=160386 RepID=G7HZZ2_9CORY|nr:ECF transporter S component [Corynebacterium casei]AHI19120.1 HMP/thiamine permease [Corynebacterium casei LMG S-19264]MDN5706149.1 ECF transporter S component [Corynebacterium casei]MDN5728661.1 ECF transporter S component [Corynebacterium casei]MDN5783431.1 ECF transporter S component [Corynebacterium casei]MDN5798728.1 ECF transporter S component [Corynebacterium casei]